MSATWKDRLLLGAGAGACAVCCAAPLLAFLGIAGVAATIGTFVFAGALSLWWWVWPAWWWCCRGVVLSGWQRVTRMPVP
jgi:hypothetical protein